MFKNDKTAILLQHWAFARSPSLKETNNRTNVFPQSSFPKGGETTTAHLQQNNTKKNKNKEFPNVPPLRNTKIKSINLALQQGNPPSAGQEGAPWKGLWGTQRRTWGWGPRAGGGELSWTLFAVWLKLNRQTRSELAVKLHFFRKHPRQLPFSRMCHFLCSYNNILSKGRATILHIYICIDAVHRKDSRMLCIYNSRNRQKAFCLKVWEMTTLK